MTVEGVRRLVGPAIATILGIAFLIGLGLWQLQRLAWKEALIAEVETRVGGPPAPLPPRSAWTALKPADYEYSHVFARGVFDSAHQALVFRALELPHGRYAGQGYLVLTPLLLDGGGSALVNRGFVPMEKKDAIATPTGEVAVTGLLRASEPRNFFTPADDPANGQWFTRDVGKIAQSFGLDDAAPFSIDADAGAVGELPQGGETVLAFPNNHFEYALTWFGMALALAGVFTAFAIAQLRAAKSPSSDGGR